MAFVASKVLWAFTQPSNLILLLLVAGIALSWTRWRTWGRRVATFATIAFVAIPALPIGSWLFVALETRFSAPQTMSDSVDGIVVLGGATSPSLTARWNQPIINENSELSIGFQY